MKWFRRIAMGLAGGYFGIGLLLTLYLWFTSGILIPELIFTWPWVVRLFLSVI